MKAFNKTLKLGIFSGALLTGMAVQAAPAPYAGAELSESHFKIHGVSGGFGAHDNDDPATRIYGGVKLNDNFGVEAGYVYLNHFRDDFVTPGGTATQSAHAQALYAVGTVSVPLGAGFEAAANLGVAQGHVTKMSLPDGEKLGGDRVGFTDGASLRYNINQHFSAGVDYQHFAKLSEHVKASTTGIDLRYSF